MAVIAMAGLAHAERRFALVVGENHGNAGDEALRFAEDDAQRMRDVLVELGQVAPSDAVFVRGATAASVRVALEGLRTVMRAAAQPGDRLVVYVSSHAGEGALHLNGSELPLAELVDFVKQAPVDVGLLIIDACRAGSMTRVKGLRATPNAPPVVIEASGLHGRVLISASGADEYAQESDALGGSAFTHFLVLALRGAADVSKDGRVTLDEAYAWAWARTLESTFGSNAGAQHPSVKIDLHGEGQLVLTEPGQSRSRLTLGIDAPGHWLITQDATRAVMADVVKPDGPLTLALPPGAYTVRLRGEDGLLTRQVRVPADGSVVVRDTELEKASAFRTLALKGSAPASFTFSAAAAVSSGLVNGLSAQPGAELRLRRDAEVFKAINELNATFSWRNGTGVPSGFVQNELQLAIGAGHLFRFQGIHLFTGLQAGALLALQTNLPNLPARTAMGPVAFIDAELTVPLVESIGIALLGSAGGALMLKETGLTVVPRVSASLGLLFDWER